MKNLKVLLLICAVVTIIAGTVMISVKGFNYALLYSNTQRLNIYFENDFEISEIKDIAKEVMGNSKVEVVLGNQFGNVASIISKEINEEQVDSIINKINEKYNNEIDKEKDIITLNVAQANLMNMVNMYFKPLILITVVTLIYLAVRFRKQGLVNSLIMPVVSTVIVLGLYVSLVAIARIPVNEFFAIVMILLFILTLICNTVKLTKAEN